MTYKMFFKLFERYARRMRGVISYREMIRNIRHPAEHWGPACPFFCKYRDCFFAVAKNGRVVSCTSPGDEEDPPKSAEIFIIASDFWREHARGSSPEERSLSFRELVINILKELMAEEKK